MTDGQLLESFIHRKDQAAFASLVRVHGPMVFGVCQRVLTNHHDAEEAFQATFLVLSRKAKSIATQASLANWLYGVAHRTALNAKRMRAIRRVREQSMNALPEAVVASQAPWEEIAPQLDQELSRLPEKYRAPIVLCDLEGQSQKDVAHRLGCPEGTLSSRLTRAREMLRTRLARHGVAVPIGALAIALSQQAASASVPAGLLLSTVQMVNVWATSSAVTAGVVSPHVAALTEGVLKTMFYSQLKQIAVAVSVIVVAGFGAGGLIYQMHAAEPGANQKDVLEKLQGQWKIVKLAEPGRKDSDEKLQTKKPTITFTDKKVIQKYVKRNGTDTTIEGSLKINTTKQPFEMDWSDNVETSVEFPNGQKLSMRYLGIFEFDGDELNIHFSVDIDGKDPKGNPAKRPTDFSKTEADLQDKLLMTLQREKP